MLCTLPTRYVEQLLYLSYIAPGAFSFAIPLLLRQPSMHWLGWKR